MTPWMLQGESELRAVSASQQLHGLSGRCPETTLHGLVCPAGILFSGDPAECHQAQPTLHSLLP